MAIIKNTPRYLDKDSDYKVVNTSAMTDALNLKISTDENGNNGVIKNIKGNSAVNLSESLPSGDNRVIGAYEYKREDTIYFFVANDTGAHTIWKYKPSASANAVKVLEEEALQLDPEGELHIDGFTFNEEVYLYYTDGLHDPKKVNITAAEAGGYPSGTTLADKLLELTVVKKPPVEPTAVFSYDETIQTNALYGKSFQFAAQYIYRDGEESALGMYSDLYIGPNTLNSVDVSESYKQLYNTLTVTVPTITDAVESVRLFFREGSEGVFNIIETKDVVFANSTLDFTFRNDKVYPALSESETNKIQNSVPKTAQTQAIAGSRLMYGNYTEGFDVPNVSGTITPTYHDIPVKYDFSASGNNASLNTTPVVDIDISSYPDGLNEPTDVIIDLTMGVWKVERNTTSSVSVTTTLFGAPTTSTDSSTFVNFATGSFVVNGLIPFGAYATRDAFGAAFAAAMIGVERTVPVVPDASTFTEVFDTPNGVMLNVHYAGSVTMFVQDATYNSTLDEVRLEIQVKSYDLYPSYVEHTGTSVIDYSPQGDEVLDNSVLDDPFKYNTVSITASDGYATTAVENKTFKSNELHSFGVVLVDEYGRHTGVQDLGSVFVAPRGDVSRGGLNGAAHVSIQMDNPVPADFERFFFVYGGGSKYEDFVQYTVVEAATLDDGSTDKIYLSLRGLQGKEQSYVDNDGANIGYQFSEGDQLRIVSYFDSSGDIRYPINYVFNVVGLETLEASSTILNLSGSPSTAQREFRTEGQWLVLSNESRANFDFTAIDGYTDFWKNGVVVEIYSPKSEQTTKVYYGCGDSYPMSSWNTANEIIGGNAYLRTRKLYSLNYLVLSTGGSINPNVNTLISQEKWIEDFAFNDFVESEYSIKGKPFAVISNEKEQLYDSSITYSDAMAHDSNVLRLGSFNNSLANWKDLNREHGGVYGLISQDDRLIALQEDKVAFVPVSRDIIFSPSGDGNVALSSSILGSEQYIQGELGINKDRTAFVYNGAELYFADISRGAIYKLSQSGVEKISSLGMGEYFEDLFEGFREYTKVSAGPNGEAKFGYRINMGYDRASGEMIISPMTYTRSVPNVGTPDTIYEPIVDSRLQSVIYSADDNVWTTITDIAADCYSNLGSTFYHFRIESGSPMWVSEGNAVRNNFFGTQYNSEIELVFNDGASVSKGFNAISIEGDSAADVTITTKSQSVNVLEEAFDEREDEWFARVPRAAGNNEYVVLGKVSAEADPNITFYNRVNRVNFRLNGDVYEYDGTNFNALAGVTVDGVVDANTLSMTNAGSVFVNDILAVKGESIADGDPIKGYYAKAKFTFDDTSAIEIFAINAQVSREKLHNDVNSQQ